MNKPYQKSTVLKVHHPPLSPEQKLAKKREKNRRRRQLKIARRKEEGRLRQQTTVIKKTKYLERRAKREAKELLVNDKKPAQHVALPMSKTTGSYITTTKRYVFNK
uniref:Uncharacterized protein n=1 Tax=Rhizophagus irregularis (strain DAOM 181602 / DAOM 197198 / MUCL 43194) TaxID=747089 RepID=U9TY68_RHIID